VLLPVPLLLLQRLLPGLAAVGVPGPVARLCLLLCAHSGAGWVGCGEPLRQPCHCGAAGDSHHDSHTGDCDAAGKFEQLMRLHSSCYRVLASTIMCLQDLQEDGLACATAAAAVALCSSWARRL
jgi:hypothetical protein